MPNYDCAWCYGANRTDADSGRYMHSAGVVDRDMFASELVVRVHRAQRRWVEVPIELIEKRPPSIHLFRRVPNVLKNIIRLTMIIRLGRDL